MSEPVRKVDRVDLVILAAALALGLGLGWRIERHEPRRPLGIYELYQHGIDYAVPCLGASSFALLVLRLRPPRPRLLALLKQPGTIACVVAAPWQIECALLVRSSPSFLFMCLAVTLGELVLVAWLVARWQRFWEPEPGWIDRAGRVLGACWIGLALAFWFQVLLIF
jgi:hypothetical protein